LQPFHGVKAHKSLDKATPHWRNHKTNGDSDASKSSAKKNHLLPAAHCFDGGNANESSAKEKHLLPAAHCFGDSNASK
jgi:hypothetical protein